MEIKEIRSIVNKFFNEQIDVIKEVVLNVAETVWYYVNIFLGQVEKMDGTEKIKEELYNYSIKINYVANEVAKMIEEMKENVGL